MESCRNGRYIFNLKVSHQRHHFTGSFAHKFAYISGQGAMQCKVTYAYCIITYVLVTNCRFINKIHDASRVTVACSSHIGGNVAKYIPFCSTVNRHLLLLLQLLRVCYYRHRHTYNIHTSDTRSQRFRSRIQ